LLQPVLCGWTLYMAVLALLAALSAGRRSRSGRLALLALGFCLAAIVMLWWPLGRPWRLAWEPLAEVDLLRFLPDLAVFLIAAGILVGNRRQDTRLIALLLAGASLFPLSLHFWRP
jgi:hypothetical protein